MIRLANDMFAADLFFPAGVFRANKPTLTTLSAGAGLLVPVITLTLRSFTIILLVNTRFRRLVFKRADIARSYRLPLNHLAIILVNSL